VWLLWLLSQTWITLHIWTPKAERLATTERLFVLPMYDSLLIDQSLGLNRRCDDEADVKTEVRMSESTSLLCAAFAQTLRLPLDMTLHLHCRLNFSSTAFYFSLLHIGLYSLPSLSRFFNLFILVFIQRRHYQQLRLHGVE
jgi:hypothetical protein